MNTIKLKKNKAKIIAHRGLSGIECENSIAAFVAAGNRSYFGIETDIHVTADKKFVVHHDDSALRMTGADVIMEETTLENLQKLPLYNKEEGKFRSDLCMPTLEEYIDICKKYEKKASNFCSGFGACALLRFRCLPAAGADQSFNHRRSYIRR